MSRLYRTTLEALFICLCVVGFVFQCRESFQKYLDKDTTTTTGYEKPKPTSLTMPSVTLCLEPSFRMDKLQERGFADENPWDFYNFEITLNYDIVANWSRELWEYTTYSVADVIKTLEVKNYSLTGRELTTLKGHPVIIYREFGLKYKGKCFFMSFNTTFGSYDAVRFTLLSPWPDNEQGHFILYLSEQDLDVPRMGFEANSVKVHINKAYDITLRKDRNILLPEVHEEGGLFPCRPWTTIEYQTCIDQRRIQARLQYNCSLPTDPKDFHFPFCTDPETVSHLISIDRNIYFKKAICQKPCVTETFLMSPSAFASTTRNEARLWLFYDTLNVIQYKEYLLYDFNQILSAVGGSLGLFLGFSCLDVGRYAMTRALDLIMARFGRKI